MLYEALLTTNCPYLQCTEHQNWIWMCISPFFLLGHSCRQKFISGLPIGLEVLLSFFVGAALSFWNFSITSRYSCFQVLMEGTLHMNESIWTRLNFQTTVVISGPLLHLVFSIHYLHISCCENAILDRLSPETGSALLCKLLLFPNLRWSLAHMPVPAYQDYPVL